uniref:Zinc finger PHD-type domain-containing protein n=1 Tax=Anopheles epiroticus TaxID=199890 RepID=A0A182NZL0_9DIPT
MVSDSQKRKAIREFLIPDTLKDDIAYCQRSLRDCVKVHQYFAQRCNSLSVMQQEQVRRFLLELEDEMQAIGKEQNGLVQDLARRLKHFQRKTATEKHIELGDDLANGYVAWVLSSHAEVQCNTAYVPHAVSERLNESQLYQKYRLVDPLLSCIADPSTLPELPIGQDTRLRKRPVLQTSLLKPKEERDLLLNSTALKEKPSLTAPSTPPTAPAPLPARTGGNRRKTPPEQPLVPTKILRSRSTTPVVVTVKQEPKVKEEPLEPEASLTDGIDLEDRSTPPIVIRETAAVKRSRTNLLQALNKVKSKQKIVSKAQSAQTSSSPPKGGRNGRAGSVSAVEQQRSSSVSSDSSNSRASTPGSASNNGATTTGSIAQHKQTPSDEISIGRSLLLPPEEPACSLPTNIDEWEQYSFLKLFGLYTIEESNLLKGRKNERKRRSCCSTERKEYHYGRFDYYEQQFYIVQKRRYNVSKRLLYTATSAETSIKKRKPWAGSGVATIPSPPPASLPMQDIPVDIKPTLQNVPEEKGSVLCEPENKLCCVCNKDGTEVDAMLDCTDCSNKYHLSCRENEDESSQEAKQMTDSKTVLNDGNDNDSEQTESHPDGKVQLQPPERNNRCPVCVGLAKSSIK